MIENNYVIVVNDNEYVSKFRHGLFGFKFDTVSSDFGAFKFKKEDAEKLVNKYFSSDKRNGKVAEITCKKNEYSQFGSWDTYVGDTRVNRRFFGDVFNMHGRYAIELKDGERLTLHKGGVEATDDPVFFLRFKDYEEAQRFITPVLKTGGDMTVVEVPEIDETIENTFGFKRLTAESNRELDKMLDAYIRGGWKLHGDRDDKYYSETSHQIVVREKHNE
jgi:hypothetical protein